MNNSLKQFITYFTLFLIASIIFFNLSYDSKATNYFAVPNQAMLDTITLPANTTPNNGGSPGWAMFFDLIAGPVDLTVTQMSTASNAPASGSFSVEVFTRSGTALGTAGTDTAGWTSIGTVPVVQGSTANGVSLLFTVPSISIDAGDTVGVALLFIGAGPRYYGTGTPPYGVFSDSNLTLITGDSRSAPFTTGGSYFHSRGLCGVIRYVVNPTPPPATFHYNALSGSGNTFPLGQTAGKFVNWLFPPGVFTNPTPCLSGQQIDTIWIRMYGTGSRTYTNLHVLMAQTTLTNLTTGQFYPGPWDTVYQRASQSLTSPGANTWMPIALDYPYAYDTSKALVVGIGQCAGSGSGMYVLQTSLSGIKRTWSVGGCPFVPYSSGDAYNLCMGISVTPLSGITPISNIPDKFNLSQNYPNPFNPTTTINFNIPKKEFVVLKVYNVLGKEVATLVNETKNEGSYNVNFDASALSSGTYFYRLEAGDFVDTKKMLLVK